jgi:hypothetical protein
MLSHLFQQLMSKEKERQEKKKKNGDSGQMVGS